MTFVRGSNPIWFEVNLTAHPFDDTYYMFVLENTLPYLPAVVYHSPDGTPWTNPIRFLANGTLPVDIFFDPEKVYRLEFRQGNTQSAPLIYLVENYQANGGGSGPITTTAVISDNQVTNPQFALINFNSPITLSGLSSPAPIEVAPGWFLNLVGSGSVTLERVALNDTVMTPTNAPYALRMTLSGSFGSAYLSQRFQQNGNLWSTDDVDMYVASSITARLQAGSQDISADIYNSENELLTTVLSVTAVSESWVEYTGHGLMPAPQDASIPPAGYIEYRLNLPTSVDIYVTSLQLVASVTIAEPSYIQDTVERQIDYTFHYYKDQLINKPIPSYTLGWDFAFNPCQLLGPTVTAINTGTNGSAYIADQTIIFQTVNSAIGATFNNTGMVLNTASDTSFSVIQYLDAATAVELLNQKNAFTIKGKISTGAGTINARVNLYWTQNVSAPVINTPDFDSLVTSITAGIPAVVSGWVEVPRGSLPAVCAFSTASQEFKFNGWDARAVSSINSATFYAVVITFENMLTTQQLTLNYAALCAGDIATIPAPLNKAQTRDALGYYLETSYAVGPASGSNTATCIRKPMVGLNPGGGGGTSSYAMGFNQSFIPKRAIPLVTFIAESSATVNAITMTTYQAGAAAANADAAAPTDGTGTIWTSAISQTSISMAAISATGFAHVGSNNVPFYSVGSYNYISNAQIGVV